MPVAVVESILALHISPEADEVACRVSFGVVLSMTYSRLYSEQSRYEYVSHYTYFAGAVTLSL